MSTRVSAYPTLVAWTAPLAEDTGMNIRIVQESQSELMNIWVKEGRFFMKRPYQTAGMFYTAGKYARRDAGPWASRIFMAGGQSFWSMASLGDSGLNTPEDIKPGMKVTMLTSSEAPQQSVYAVLAWGNINPEDIVMIPLGSPAQSYRYLIDERSDFGLCYYATSSYYEVEASPKGMTVMELDYEANPEGAARFMDVWYTGGWGVCPEGGLPSFAGKKMSTSMTPFITSLNYDPELVYQLIDWTFQPENFDRFKDGHPYNKTMNPETTLWYADHSWIPLHPSLVRWFDENGMWTEERQARQQYNIEQQSRWVNAYQTAIGMADDQGIPVNPESEEWVKLWENYLETNELPLLQVDQGPGIEQKTYWSYFNSWNAVKPFQD
jgi:hypothetical protein